MADLFQWLEDCIYGFIHPDLEDLDTEGAVRLALLMSVIVESRMPIFVLRSLLQQLKRKCVSEWSGIKR